MHSIDRQIAIIKPREPYVEWINSIASPEDSSSIDELNKDCTAYLIPHFDDDTESNVYIKTIYKKIFEIELESWSLDKGTWPKKRSYPLFKKWFNIEFHSEVIDVLKTSIVKEQF